MLEFDKNACGGIEIRELDRGRPVGDDGDRLGAGLSGFKTLQGNSCRHRTVRTKGSLSSATAKIMVFKLITGASKTWRRLNGTNQLPKIIGGVRFRDGIEVTEVPATRAA